MSSNSPVLAKLLRDNPIAITGTGCFSAAGNSVEQLWKAASAGQSLAAWREFVDHGRPVRFAVCAAPEIDIAAPELRLVRKADRSAQMAVLAAGQAWTQARLSGVYPPGRTGVMLGSSRGTVGKMAEAFSASACGGIMPSMSAQSSPGALSGAVAQLFELKGPGMTASATCASAAFAIALAAEQILLGTADAMLAGGAEAPLNAVILTQLQAAGVLGFHEDASQTCRPFNATRNGMVLGEGSAFLALEPARLAERRGARVLGLLTGWSMSVDGFGRAGVREDGAALFEAMEQALALAGIPPEKIGYVNAHGSGTALNDAAEAQAMSRLFGAHAVPCSSTKPVTGHCLGATPALEAVLCLEALRRKELPLAVNCAQPDSNCPVRLVNGSASTAPLAAVMSNSLGFWGYHASLVFSAAEKIGITN